MSAHRPPSQPAREDFGTDDQVHYDRVIARYHGPSAPPGARVKEYFAALLNSPPLCAIACEMGTFVRTAGEREGTYSHADREFVDQVLSADWSTNVVQELHVPDAVAAGVRIEAIEALRYGHEEDLTDDERLLATYIRQVIAGAVTDESFRAMTERLGLRGLVEYTGFILWLQWIIRMMQTLGTDNPPDDVIDQLIEDVKSGSAGVTQSEWRSRLK